MPSHYAELVLMTATTSYTLLSLIPYSASFFLIVILRAVFPIFSYDEQLSCYLL